MAYQFRATFLFFPEIYITTEVCILSLSMYVCTSHHIPADLEPSGPDSTTDNRQKKRDQTLGVGPPAHSGIIF
jgi:hypothetical protein